MGQSVYENSEPKNPQNICFQFLKLNKSAFNKKQNFQKFKS